MSGSPFLKMDELVGRCCAALEYFSNNAESFSGSLFYCRDLHQHFAGELADLVAHLENCPPRENAAARLVSFGNVQACCFALFEDMALFCREKYCRNECISQHEAEDAIMAFFEGSGNWPRDSQVMVTDMYYHRIPLAVKGEIFAA